MGILETTTTLIYLEYDQDKFNCSQMLGSPYIWSVGLKVINVGIYFFPPLLHNQNNVYTNYSKTVQVFLPRANISQKDYSSSAIMPLYYQVKEEKTPHLPF